jgi:hypothetical protein
LAVLARRHLGLNLKEKSYLINNAGAKLREEASGESGRGWIPK